MALGSREAGREFEIRCCGILVHGDAVLVTQEADGLYAMPGGHLEFGETLALCLSREIFEETGLNVEADKLVYVVENFFVHRGVDTHEIGFYFLVDLSSEFPTPDRDGFIPANEARVRPRLLPLGQLRNVDLRPHLVRDALPGDARDAFSHPTRHLVSRGE